VPEGTDTRHAAVIIDDLLPFEGVDVDIVTTTPARLEAAWDDYGSVLHWAQEQGVILYQVDAHARTESGVAMAETQDDNKASEFVNQRGEEGAGARVQSDGRV